MRQNKSFVAIILIGFGFYFLMQQYTIPVLSQFNTWPTILVILGVAFLFSAYGNRQYDNILPGIILFGLGIHFHAINHSANWIDHWGMYTLIIGVAFILRAQKTNQGTIIGIILIIISFVALSSFAMPSWFGWLDFLFNSIEQFWPLLLIIIGLTLLFKK
ncbi:LiaI-LiaF-like domain-containing protein [Alkalibacillus silvisoli]|uniref:LiaI-LiaF-like transmembrane region domain-containing protein n=1 Tax=Alkalibacillus silvisoli TaxID=392823 RepID=A0ABN0ZRK2_9BACI